MLRPTLASAVLALHLAVILFNVGGLVVIPLGAWRGWGFVRGFRWRLLHLASLGVVALQAVLGKVCFLTLWQSELAGAGTAPQPLIARLIDRIVFWPLPLWVFAVLYVAVAAYVVALWFLVRPRRRRSATN